MGMLAVQCCSRLLISNTQAVLESNGHINRQKAYALASTDLEKLLGIRVNEEMADLVAYDGGSAFELSSKVVAVISPERAAVDLF
jgi:hypothetical protein